MLGLDLASDESVESAGGVVFRDVIMLALLGFVAIVILLLPYINPPAEETTEEIVPPGDVVIEIRWPDDIDADVDLWVKAPDDVPVGYSNKNGDIFDLLRDDVGFRSDTSGLNYEFSFSRGRPAGEYVVNIHLFSDWSGSLSVPVRVTVSVKRDGSSRITEIFTAEVFLERVGQELTVVRFTLNESGQVTEQHDTPVRLRPSYSRPSRG